VSEQCGAHHENGKQCRATRGLARVNVTLNGEAGWHARSSGSRDGASMPKAFRI
jgi:hypothetical protein